MERNKEFSYCCGAGGGVKSAFPEFATKTAVARIEEAEDTGAEIIASACPFSLRFYDISELLLMALDSPPKTVKELSTEVR